MMLDPGLGHWLAGFFDGEGCFVIQKQPGDYYTCRAVVQVRGDDAAVLYQLSEATGLGVIYHKRKRRIGHAQVSWSIHRQADCRALVSIFDTYPLRAKKARDYAIWREAVLLWTSSARGRRGTPSTDVWKTMAMCKEHLSLARQHSPSLADPETARTLPAVV